jgi:LysM repeat protein
VRLIKRSIGKTPRKKLRAAAQRSSAKYAEEDYYAEEPNVRLSRAFVVVLLLHVVAVGGIFAFSALKDRQQTSPLGKGNSANSKSSIGSGIQSGSGSPRPSGELSQAANSVHKVKGGETLASIASQYGLTVRDLEQANSLKPGASLAVGRDLVIPEVSKMKPVPLDVQKLVESSRQSGTKGQGSTSVPEKPTDDAGKFYVVQRGDSPAAIARKFKVSYPELLKANNIEDPKKLQIGQKLIIPTN